MKLHLRTTRCRWPHGITLPATRQKWTRPALTDRLVLLTYPGGMEGWVDLGEHTEMVYRAGDRTPRTPRSGGPHACSGASCFVGEPFWARQNAKNLLVAPDPTGGAYIAPPDPLAGGKGLRPRGLCCPSPRTPLTILSFCLPVCMYTCV